MNLICSEALCIVANYMFKLEHVRTHERDNLSKIEKEHLKVIIKQLEDRHSEENTEDKNTEDKNTEEDYTYESVIFYANKKLYCYNNNNSIDVIQKELDSRKYKIRQKMVININGTQLTIGNGRMHSFNDQPSYIINKGVYRSWHKNGKLHRDCGPAIVIEDIWFPFENEEVENDVEIIKKYDDYEEEYKNMISTGAIPANFINDARQEWWQNGLLHREGSPAILYKDGREVYYKNGKLHREDGPAEIYPNGIYDYTINDYYTSYSDTYEDIYKVAARIYYANDEIHRDGDLPAIEFANGNKEYYKNGSLHREGDFPAVEHSNGTLKYYKNGKKHRDGDLPSVIYSSGELHYHKNGELHRIGKPASIYFDGTVMYYKNGKLHRDDDLPALISGKGQIEYWVDGKRHREGDKPAVIYTSGRLDYYIKGRLHREGDLPAIFYSDGRKGDYFKNGHIYNPFK